MGRLRGEYPVLLMGGQAWSLYYATCRGGHLCPSIYSNRASDCEYRTPSSCGKGPIKPNNDHMLPVCVSEPRAVGAVAATFDNQLLTPVIPTGDLNAYNTIWSIEVTDSRGQIIEKL